MAINTTLIYDGVKTGLGICVADSAIITQLEFHTNSAIHFFGDIKGIKDEVLESPSGITLITIYVNDIWRGTGEFNFSPATDILFDSLMTYSRRLEDA